MIYTFIGDGYSRGKQHGTQLRQAILDRVANSLPLDLDASQRARIAQPWIVATEELDFDLLAEMAGIADGAGAPLADVVLLNSFEAFNLAEMVEKGGCTAVGVSENGKTVLAQNWDANAQLAIGLAVHRHRSPDGTDVAMLASPGGLGWIGMNGYGLGLVNNDLLGGPTASAAPSQVIRRVLLKNRDTASAVAAAEAMGHPALRSYLLADAAGSLAGLEALPFQPPARTPVPALGLVHANHAVAPDAREVEDSDLQESVYPSSAHRAKRAQELLERTRSESDQHGRVLELLRDHDGLPLSICRHESVEEPTATASTVVFDCTAQRAEFYLGLACTPDSLDVVDFHDVNDAPG